MDCEKYTSCTINLKESIKRFKEIDFSQIKRDNVATTLVPQYLKDTFIALR